MHPAGQIEFLFRRRFPAHTDQIDKVAGRIARENKDPDLQQDDTLNQIADELGFALRRLRIIDEPIKHMDIANKDRDHTGRLLPGACERLRVYLDAARDYKEELFEMSGDERWALYCAERKKELVEKEVKGAENDRYEFFNEPDAVAKFEHWMKAESWSPEDAVALSLGKEPKRVNSETLRPHHPPSPFREEYARRLELVLRAVKGNRFGEDIEPARFLQWAREVGLSYPEELEPLREAFGDDREAGDARDTAAVNRSAEAKRRNTLLRLLIAVASQRYDIDPFASPAPTIDDEILRRVREDFATVGLTAPADKVIKRRLGDAINRARDDRPSKIRAAKAQPHSGN